ncbi:hypothetical protein [Streptomyces pharetrae]
MNDLFSDDRDTGLANDDFTTGAGQGHALTGPAQVLRAGAEQPSTQRC